MSTAARPSGIRRAVALVLALAVFAALVCLGTWQLRRLAWKEALIARVEERVAAPAVPLPDPAAWAGLTPEAIEYLPVRFTGTFDHAREVHVFIALSEPRGPFGGQGYFVMTPLTLDDGHVVFVNRGFVPADRKDPSTRRDGQVEGRVSIEGLIRPAEHPSWISPAPDLARNVWFVRDPAAMAEAVGLDPATVAPFTVDARAGQGPGELPQGGETIVSFPNNHLGYALTWYGLAAALVGVVGTLFLRRRL